MPELPEVESLRRALQPRLVGRCVRAVRLHRRDVAVGPEDPPGGFSRQRCRGPTPARLPSACLLAGARVQRLARRGKALAIVAADGRCLGVHLGMTGQLLWAPPRRRLPTDHVHATWRLDDGSRLVFRDPRRFGGLWAAVDLASLPTWRRLGPDALTIGPASLRSSIGGSSRAVKAALLDQHAIAGVGNIYADESLFQAGISPTRACNTLSDRDFDRLARAIGRILRAAIEAGGSSIRDYRLSDGARGGYQARHAVYGRRGKPCVRCGRPLAGGVVAQRATVWCAHCQVAEAGHCGGAGSFIDGLSTFAHPGGVGEASGAPGWLA